MENTHVVLDDVKDTPRYYKKAKYEMYAKLDNFGPFQWFFTLSSPELRWDENFGAILMARKCNIRYVIESDRDGYPKTSVYVDYEKDGNRIIICRSCSMGCHHGHEINILIEHKYENVQSTDSKCKCRERHPICIFRK